MNAHWRLGTHYLFLVQTLAISPVCAWWHVRTGTDTVLALVWGCSRTPHRNVCVYVVVGVLRCVCCFREGKNDRTVRLLGWDTFAGNVHLTMRATREYHLLYSRSWMHIIFAGAREYTHKYTFARTDAYVCVCVYVCVSACAYMRVRRSQYTRLLCSSMVSWVVPVLIHEAFEWNVVENCTHV